MHHSTVPFTTLGDSGRIEGDGRERRGWGGEREKAVREGEIESGKREGIETASVCELKTNHAENRVEITVVRYNLCIQITRSSLPSGNLYS
jgi:hypothetical protein